MSNRSRNHYSKNHVKTVAKNGHFDNDYRAVFLENVNDLPLK